MKIMAAHEIWSLNQASAGTVDGTSYDQTDLVKANDDPILTPGDSASFSIPLAAGTTNGLVLFNHSLGSGVTASFSGLGSVVAPAVPPSGIRLTAWASIADTSNPGSTTMSISANGGVNVIIQLAMVGLFREIRTFPPDNDYGFRIFEVPNTSEYGGFSYSRGATARNYGGDVLLTRAERDILWRAFDAADNNSKPTVIEVDGEAWVVTWTSFNPRIKHGGQADLFSVNVAWTEMRRLRMA